MRLTPHSSRPRRSSAPERRKISPSRCVNSPAQTITPITGTALGTWKWSCSTRSRRLPSTARLTPMNAISSRVTVVSASASRSPVAISSIATTVVKTMATIGVRRPGWTRRKTAGTTRSSPIPYSRREAVIRLIRMVLASANRAIAAKSFVSTASGPSLTTSSSGPSEPASRSVGTAIDATIDTEVDQAADEESTEDRARVGAARLLGLLRDVHRVLEADQRVERERGAGEHEEGDRVRALLELEGAARAAVAARHEDHADEQHEQQPAQLDH